MLTRILLSIQVLLLILQVMTGSIYIPFIIVAINIIILTLLYREDE